MKLGLRTSLQLACAREKSRGPDTGLQSPAVQLDSSHIRGLLLNIFRIQTNGAANAGPFTAPLNPSGKLDRASALPAVSNAPFFFGNWVLMVVSIAFSRLLPQHHQNQVRSLRAHRRRKPTLRRTMFLTQSHPRMFPTQSRFRRSQGEVLDEAGTIVVRHGGRFRRLTSEAPCVHRQVIGAEMLGVVVYSYYVVSLFVFCTGCRSNVTLCCCYLRHWSLMRDCPRASQHGYSAGFVLISSISGDGDC